MPKGYHFDLSLPAVIAGARNEIAPKTGTPGIATHCDVEGQEMIMGIWMDVLDD